MKILGLSQQFIVIMGVMLMAATAATLLISLIFFNCALAPLALAEGVLAIACLITSDTRFVIK